MQYRYWFILVLVLTIIATYIWYRSYDVVDRKDFRIAYINEEGILLKSISTKRRMVNIVDIKGGVKVWVPGGLGWYESSKIDKLLAQEKQREKANDILFNNFGFYADQIIFGRENQNGEWFGTISAWGLRNYITYMVADSKNMMVKQEIISGQLNEEADLLSIIMPRDFADSQIVEEGVNVYVYNIGAANGLANFMARNLEWMGMAVLGVESISKEMGKDMCVVVFGQQLDQGFTWSYLKKMFEECRFEKDGSLGDNELELYLGDKYAGMLNYQSYNTLN